MATRRPGFLYRRSVIGTPSISKLPCAALRDQHYSPCKLHGYKDHTLLLNKGVDLYAWYVSTSQNVTQSVPNRMCFPGYCHCRAVDEQERQWFADYDFRQSKSSYSIATMRHYPVASRAQAVQAWQANSGEAALSRTLPPTIDEDRCSWCPSAHHCLVQARDMSHQKITVSNVAIQRRGDMPTQ